MGRSPMLTLVGLPNAPSSQPVGHRLIGRPKAACHINTLGHRNYFYQIDDCTELGIPHRSDRVDQVKSMPRILYGAWPMFQLVGAPSHTSEVVV